MTNEYGIQKLPDIHQCTDYRDKYWGWIKTCTATEDFTLKHIFMNKGGIKNSFSIIPFCVAFIY